MIALPLLARLYVRKKDLPAIDPKHRPVFRTKLELAVEFLRWAEKWTGLLKKPIRVVADGAFARANFLKPAKELGIAGPAGPAGMSPPAQPIPTGTTRVAGDATQERAAKPIKPAMTQAAGDVNVFELLHGVHRSMSVLRRGNVRDGRHRGDRHDRHRDRHPASANLRSI